MFAAYVEFVLFSTNIFSSIASVVGFLSGTKYEEGIFYLKKLAGPSLER